jgi:hypothetical protein
MTVHLISRIEGVWEILNKLDDIEVVFHSGVKDTAISLRTLVEARTPMGTKGPMSEPGYQPGTLRKSWGRVREYRGGFTFENIAGYADILEYGLYERVGPRTMQSPSGIFSKQAVGGMLRPMIDDPQVVSDFLDLIVDRVIKEIVRGARA